MLQYILTNPTSDQENVLADLTNKEQAEHVLDHVAIKFSDEVINTINVTPDNSAISCLLEVCINHDVTEETVLSLITPKLMQLLEADSESRHLFKRLQEPMRLF